MTGSLRFGAASAALALTALLSSVAQGQGLCPALFIESADSAEIEKIKSLLKNRDFAGIHARYGDSFYFKNRHLFDDHAQSLLFSAIFTPRGVNVEEERSGSLSTPLAAGFNSFWNVGMNYQVRLPGRDVGQRFNSENTVFNKLQTFIWRGDPSGDDFPPDWLSDRTSLHHFFSARQEKLSTLMQPTQKILQGIYASFAKQGPERQVLVPIVTKQDKKDLHRTTHFVIGLGAEPTPLRQRQLRSPGHLQVMTSTGASEPLHVDDQWGQIKRHPGEVIAELGRFDFPKDDERVEGAQDNAALSREQKYMMRLLLWQKVFSWMNHDVTIDRVFFQINDRVRDTLLGYGIPLQRARSRRVMQVFQGKAAPEWIFEMDRATMLLTEERLMASILEQRIEWFARAWQPPQGFAHLWDATYQVQFQRNEIWALENLGLIQILDKPFESELPTSLYGFGRDWTSKGVPYEATLISGPNDFSQMRRNHLFHHGLKMIDDGRGYNYGVSPFDPKKLTVRPGLPFPTPIFQISKNRLRESEVVTLLMSAATAQEISQRLDAFAR